MRYTEALEFMFSRLPMFTRVGKAAYKSGMGNIESLCAALGNPEQQFRSIHVAGTNGKGSTSHFLASILQEAGYKTGLFTSPHLKDFRERIRINGKFIPAREVSRFVEKHHARLIDLEASFFEMNVALAFAHFAEQQVDVAVVETGLGGRLDSTNVLVPDLSIITNISFDHADLLGNTLPAIAAEKAGIIKRDVPVVVSERQEDVAHVFQNKSTETKSVIRFASDEVRVIETSWSQESEPQLNAKLQLRGAEYNLTTPLSGAYQIKNLAGVLVAIEELNSLGYQISDEHLLNGVRCVKSNTGLRGRWEKIGASPDIYCDTGHNEAGVKEVLEMIHRTPHKHLHLVWGMVNDKDIRTILSMLPQYARYYFCNASIPRAMPAEHLCKEAAGFGLIGGSYTSVRKAISIAKRKAKPDDLIVIGGSTFVVAEV